MTSGWLTKSDELNGMDGKGESKESLMSVGFDHHDDNDERNNKIEIVWNRFVKLCNFFIWVLNKPQKDFHFIRLANPKWNF